MHSEIEHFDKLSSGINNLESLTNGLKATFQDAPAEAPPPASMQVQMPPGQPAQAVEQSPIQAPVQQ